MLSIIKKAMNNDEDAFYEIIMNVHEDLFKIAYLNLSNRSFVNDAYQQTLIKAYKNIHKLRNPKFFKTWIIKILINECYQINRSEKKYVSTEEGYLENIEDEKNNFNRNLDEDSFYKILNNLDEKYRIVIYLHYGEELKIKEIAKILDLNINTVKTRLKRGKELLKSIYNQEEQ